MPEEVAGVWDSVDFFDFGDFGDFGVPTSTKSAKSTKSHTAPLPLAQGAGVGLCGFRCFWDFRARHKGKVPLP